MPNFKGNLRVSRHIKNFIKPRRQFLVLQAIEIAAKVRLKVLRNLVLGKTKTITNEEAEQIIPILKTLGYKPLATIWTIESISAMVCEERKVSVNDLKAKLDKQIYNEARQIIVFLCSKFTDKNPKEIMEFFGLKRTSFYHCIRTVSNLQDIDKEFALELKRFYLRLEKAN